MLFTVIRLLATSMLAAGVKRAVQVTPPSLEVTVESVPLAMVRSALVKPVTASLKVKVTSEVSPIFSALSATTMVTVGRTVFTVIVTVLLASAPSILAMPPALVNLLLATDTTPLAVELIVGVKVAEYEVPLPVKLDKVPPARVISPRTKSVTDSERVNVIVAVSSAFSVDLLLEIAIVGGGESLSKIFPVADLLVTVKITVSVDSIVASSTVAIVTVNEVTPVGTVMVPSPLLTTPLLNVSEVE